MNYYDDLAYFTDRDIAEQWSWDAGILRWDDQVSALCYAFGVDPKKVYEYFKVKNMEKPDPVVPPSKVLGMILQGATRYPHYCCSVGEGRGEIVLSLLELGIEACGIEPSKHALSLWIETKKRFNFYHPGTIRLINKKLCETKVEPWDTVFFVESIEHIPREGFEEFLKKWLSIPQEGDRRLIIANWKWFHPMVDKSEEHVNLMDDAYYDKLSKEAAVVVRDGSHLVLDFP